MSMALFGEKDVQESKKERTECGLTLEGIPEQGL